MKHKIDAIKWAGDQALLIHGETTIDEAEEICYEHLGNMLWRIGPVERFRKYPAQWCDFIVDRVPEGQSLRGTFLARLIT